MKSAIFGTLLVLNAALVAARPASNTALSAREDITINLSCSNKRGTTYNLNCVGGSSKKVDEKPFPLNATTTARTKTSATATSTSIPKPSSNGTASGPKPTSFLSAAYFEAWGIYNNTGLPSYFPEDLPVSELTHAIYAFANIDRYTGKINMTDPWAELGMGKDNKTEGGTANKNVGALWKLKQKNRNLKVLLSIGGWDASVNFIKPASTPEGRAILAKSAVETMGDWGFDGIDIDWEHAFYNATHFNQTADFVALLKAFRIELDSYAKVNSPGYYFELTAAAPGTAPGVAHWDVVGMAKYLDLFNVMAYDFTGDWLSEAGVSGHHANLYRSGNDSITPCSVDAGIQAYLDAGVPASKLLLGVPAYARAFGKTSKSFGQTFSKIPKNNLTGFNDGGSLPYKLVQLKNATKTVQFDPKIGAAWQYDEGEKTLMSFDDPQVVAMKAKYAKEKGLAGMFSWTARWDKASGPEALSSTWVKELGKLTQKQNLLSYHKSKWPNIRGNVTLIARDRIRRR